MSPNNIKNKLMDPRVIAIGTPKNKIKNKENKIKIVVMT